MENLLSANSTDSAPPPHPEGRILPAANSEPFDPTELLARVWNQSLPLFRERIAILEMAALHLHAGTLTAQERAPGLRYRTQARRIPRHVRLSPGNRDRTTTGSSFDRKRSPRSAGPHPPGRGTEGFCTHLTRLASELRIAFHGSPNPGRSSGSKLHIQIHELACGNRD